MMKTVLPVLPICLALGLGLGLGARLGAQPENQDPNNYQEQQLQRAQQEILRKAERLRDLMQSLISSYEKEGRTRQVELLKKGLNHLIENSLLEEVAGVRSALDAQAMAEARRRATKVIENLERLLAILLDRRSLDKLEEEIEKASKQAASAGELLQRQTDLLQENREISRSQATPVERELSQRLRDLARMQENESQQNLREAGSRRPFLERALERIQALLRAQTRLEKGSEKELTDPNAGKAARDRNFELGALKRETTEQMADRARQRGLERLAEDARRLQEAKGRNDTEAIQEARDRLRQGLASNVRRQDQALAEKLQELLDQLEKARSEGAKAKKGPEVEAEVEKLARKEAAAQKQQSDQKLADLGKQLAEAEEKFKQQLGKSQKPGRTEANLKQARQAVERAEDKAKEEDSSTQEIMGFLSRALRSLSQARKANRERNPDAATRAANMASEAQDVANNLQESPGSRRPEGKEPEKDKPAEDRAAEDLRQAEKELRKASNQLEKQRQQTDRQSLDKKLAKARQNLEAARDTLKKELQRNAQDQQGLRQAAERQRQLQEEAKDIRQEMQGAKAAGDLSKAQAKAADRRIQQAQKQMQRARQSLKNNRQSAAAQQQQGASDSLEQARQALEQNRPLSPEQKQELRDLAREQKQLAEDIIRLAREVEKRNNQKAQQALENAARSAQAAGEELDAGENQEGEQKQEEAKEELEKAKEALEEERDRYQDLRQEELLFKIRDELEQFLKRQLPITKETIEAKELLEERQRLSRRTRRKLNELGELEQELSEKARYLRQALEKESVLVFSHALRANEEDLEEVKQRLAGRQPDPGELTVVLQKDVEARTADLIEALRKEQERRRRMAQNRQQQQGGGQQDQNNPNQNRPKQRLVSLVAELQMLMRMEEDMLKRTRFMERLFAARGDAVSDVDLALLQRLGHRHNDITRIFLELKAQVEQALNPPQEDPEGEESKKDPEKKGK